MRLGGRRVWIASVLLSAASAAVAEPKSDVEPGRKSDFGYARAMKKVDGVVYLSFDRARLLTGKEARAYSIAKGWGDDLQNDFVIANDNPKLRRLVVSPSVVVTGTGMLAMTSIPEPVTLDQFSAAVKRYKEIPVNITYDKQRRVVKIAEPFFP